MSENTKIELPKSIDNALNNILEKPTRTIGEVVSDCLFLVFGKINYKAELKRVEYASGIERFAKELEDKVDSIPEEDRIEPSVHTICTALESMRYCVEEPELREMFSTLIANSINANITVHVHPSYGEIIRQLTARDARLIMWFKNRYNVPVIRVKENSLKYNQYILLPYMFLDYSETNVEDLQISIENLSRLNLIKVIFDKVISETKLYDNIKETENYISVRNIIEKNKKDEYVMLDEYGVIELTQFGKRFIDVCC